MERQGAVVNASGVARFQSLVEWICEQLFGACCELLATTKKGQAEVRIMIVQAKSCCDFHLDHRVF
jgi:hypothetical protein